MASKVLTWDILEGASQSNSETTSSYNPPRADGTTAAMIYLL